MIFVVVAKTKEGNFGASFRDKRSMDRWLAKTRAFYSLYEYTVREL